MQINGATIGSPDFGSITDIYGAVHIDQVLIQKCPIVPQNCKRYSSWKEQECITDWMNENIEKNKIKFSIRVYRRKSKIP